MFHIKYRKSNQIGNHPDTNFDTMEEMINDDRIKKYWYNDANFYRFSLADDVSLMAEYKNGTVWYVVGDFLFGDTPAWLPEWKPVE